MIDADRLLMELHAVLRNAGSISFVTGTYKDQLVRRIEERLSAPPEALRSIVERMVRLDAEPYDWQGSAWRSEWDSLIEDARTALSPLARSQEKT